MFHEFLVYLWRNIYSSPLPIFNLIHFCYRIVGVLFMLLLFSLQVMSIFVTHGLQHTRPPCLTISQVHVH